MDNELVIKNASCCSRCLDLNRISLSVRDEMIGNQQYFFNATLGITISMGQWTDLLIEH